MPNTQKARVFRNGRSQAIRIPAEFRFTTDEVYVERNSETGALTLSREAVPPRAGRYFPGSRCGWRRRLRTEALSFVAS